MFQAMKRNGKTDIKSDWYPVGPARESMLDARNDAERHAKYNPEHDGWNHDIAVLNLTDRRVVNWIRP